MSIVETLAKLAEKRAALRQEAIAQIGSELKTFLDSHPAIDMFAWYQYTPYFNDGDECVFRVGDLHARLAGEPDDSDEREFESGSLPWFEPHYLKYNNEVVNLLPATTIEALQELVSVWRNAKDDLYAAFGDHVRVYVSGTGIDVETFEHD